MQKAVIQHTYLKQASRSTLISAERSSPQSPTILSRSTTTFPAGIAETFVETEASEYSGECRYGRRGVFAH